MKFPSTILREAESDPAAGVNGSGAPAADEATSLTIGQRLSAAVASKASLQQAITDRDKTIAEDKGEIGRLTAANTDLQAQLDAANARVTALEAEAADIDQALKDAEAEAAKEKAANATVEKKAQEIVASLGFPAAKLPAASEDAADDDVPGSRADLEKAMDKLKTADQRRALLVRYRSAQN